MPKQKSSKRAPARTKNRFLRKIQADEKRVLDSVYELLHNARTPQSLFAAVAGFICEQSNECGDNLWHSLNNLEAVLATVHPDDTRDAVIKAANASEDRQEVSQ